MPSPPHTESPAALVNFIFRQLPDEVVNELKDALHGGPHEAVISVIGGIAVAAGQDTVATGLVQNLAEDSSLPLPHGVGKGGYSIMAGGGRLLTPAPHLPGGRAGRGPPPAL